MKLIILGPPGAGKGTQAKGICDKYELQHVSSGDIFRKNIKENSQLGIEALKYINKGELIPDDLTIKIMEDTLSQKHYEEGFLLDGFPRTVKQAEALDIYLEKHNQKLDKALIIDVASNCILERITGRRVCPDCGKSYHIKFNPSKVDGICDACGSNTVQRKDDTLETVKNRLEVYLRETSPVIDYYKSKGIVSVVDGTQGIKDVLGNIFGILGSV